MCQHIGNGNPYQSPGAEYTSTDFPKLQNSTMSGGLNWGPRLRLNFLSPNTTYGVFFVFKFGRSKRGFRNRHIELRVNFEGSENGSQKREILDTPRNRSQIREILDTSTNGPQPRNDGWMEVEMGEFFNERGDDSSVVCKLFEFDGNAVKGGLIVEGIEFRPKSIG